MQHPQCVTYPWKYLIHCAFIPLNPRGLAINDVSPWPFERVYYPEFKGSKVYRIKAQFFWQIHEQGDAVWGMVNCYHLTYHRLALEPASEFNYEWYVGDEWLNYMQKVDNIMLWWQTLNWVEEVCMCLLDALGWLELAMQQLIHHIMLVANPDPPRFVTEGHFIGAMVDSYYQDAVDLAEEIAKLGTLHPILLQILEAKKKENPSTHIDSTAVWEKFSFWIQELMDQGQAMRPPTWFKLMKCPPSELAGNL
jgi:hypothetical protein